MRCRMNSLRQSTWLARISRHLKSRQIDFIVLKGIALSKLLYGDGSYRQVRDIDIMVASEHIDATESILVELGFIRKVPHAEATPKQIRFLNKHKKDRVYYHPDDGILLELHWRLIEVELPFNPSLHDLLATGSSIQVQGEDIVSMSGHYLWLYQCMHGTVAGWHRMRWVCDIALLLSFHQPDWDELLQHAEFYQCKNSLAEAVGLASTLYHLRAPEPVQRLIDQSRSIQQNIECSARSLYYMQLPDSMTYIRRIPFWAPTKNLLQALLVYTSVSPGDFRRVHLPDQLFFAYYLLRPFSFLFRCIIPARFQHARSTKRMLHK